MKLLQGHLRHVGEIRGAQFSDKAREVLGATLAEFQQEESSVFQSPFWATWVRPVIVCEIEFEEWSDQGHLVNPKVLQVRIERPQEETEAEEDESADGQSSAEGSSAAPKDKPPADPWQLNTTDKW